MLVCHTARPLSGAIALGRFVRGALRVSLCFLAVALGSWPLRGTLAESAHDTLAIELASSEYSNASRASPKLVGGDGVTIYIPADRGYFSQFFLQVKRGAEWEPKYEYECASLFDGRVMAYPPSRRQVIGVNWGEVRSTVTPKGFKVAAGIYRFSLVYTTINPGSVDPRSVPCQLITSPEFALTTEGHFTK
jgi:hypothetical protein